MTTRVSIAHGGEISSEELPTTGGVSRSTDYQPKGVTVRSTDGLGSNRTVTDQSQIQDNDLVLVDGMEIPAHVARSFGLMGRVIDDSIGAAAIPHHAEGSASAVKGAKQNDQSDSYGHEGFDTATNELNTKIESGDMSFEEATEYHTAVGEVALADMTMDEVVEAIDGFREGTLGPLDLDANRRNTIEAVESKVTATATASAKAELGGEGFDRLAELAKGNPEVNDAIRQYAVLRAQGRADVSWAGLLADAEDHVRGIR